MKPILTFLILLFFLCPPIQCTPCVPPSQGIIYVDDDGGADFTKIQDAINVALDGDTIYVYSGFYQENIVVDKAILLQGENKDSTIIDGIGNQNVVRISHWVTISGFTIQNGVDGIWLGHSSFNTITGNTITNNRNIGICLYSAGNISIKGNTVTNNQGHGISLLSSSDNTNITGNNISNNHNDGIAINDSELNYISYNNIMNNKASGIRIHYSHNNSIIDNYFSKNENMDIYLFYANNNELIGNICENSSVGIYLEESSKNHVQQNTLSHNQQGIICSYAPDNIITKNNLISNEEQAKVTTFFHKGFLIPNTWKGNYWDDWKGLCIKFIPGILYVPTKDIIGIFLPWFEVDWHPSRTPNEW